MNAMEPVGFLDERKGMTQACRDHALDTGGKGMTGHTGSDGSDPF